MTRTASTSGVSWPHAASSYDTPVSDYLESDSGFATVSPMVNPRLGRKLGPRAEPRQGRTARLPLYLDDALLKRAEEDGLTVNDTINNAIAHYVGLPLPAPPRDQRAEQQELRLKEAG